MRMIKNNPSGKRPKEKEYKISKYAGSQWYVVWSTFKKNKLAVTFCVIIILLCLVAVFAEFIAPYTSSSRSTDYVYARPLGIHIRDEEGQWHAPFVYGYTQKVNIKTFTREGAVDTSVRYPIHMFVEGEPYKLCGLIPMNTHLFGVSKKDYDAGIRVILMGSDSLGRDIFSRIVYGTRVSMFVGLVGIIFSMVIGVILGMIAGYRGGVADIIISRIIEVLWSIPSIPLWMALGAAIPQTWTTVQTFFTISLVLSLIGWGGMARTVRGKIMQMKERDYVKAAVLDNASLPRILRKYLLPSVYSPLIASATTAVPTMILGETSMSFLGLGLQPPAVSWGVLIQEAKSLSVILRYPWLLFSVVPVIIVCLAFNFVGDGLRNAADPFKN